MRKVTYQTKPIKELGGKVFKNVEYTKASDADIRIRALALDWFVVSVEAA